MTARWSENWRHLLPLAGLPELRDTFDETQANNAYQADKFAQLVGVRQAAPHVMHHGHHRKLIDLVHAEHFASVLDEADALAAGGHLIPPPREARIR